MRLRRGWRNKETAGDSPAAAPIAAADEPGPIQPPPSGSVLGLSAAISGGSTEPTNEWGLYDPDLAGIGALLSTLDTSAISFPDDLDQDPGDLLLRQQASAAKEPAEALPSDSAGGAEEATRPSRAVTAVASCRVPHLAPLSLWARVADADLVQEPRQEPDRLGTLLARWLPNAASRNGSQLASSDLAAQIGQLTHPALVALTGLSPACRICGIRTEPAAAVPEAPDERPGWPQPDVVPVPDVVAMEALDGLASGAEAAAAPEQVPAEAVVEAPVLEPIVTGPAAAPETAQASEELDAELRVPSTVTELPAVDQPPPVEPPADADAAEDPGIIVAPPALEALPTDFIMDAPQEAEPAVLPDTAAGVEAAPAAEAAPVVSLDESAPVPERAPQEPLPQEPPQTVLSPTQHPPQVVVPPAKKHRRTALALG